MRAFIKLPEMWVSVIVRRGGEGGKGKKVEGRRGGERGDCKERCVRLLCMAIKRSLKC